MVKLWVHIGRTVFSPFCFVWCRLNFILNTYILVILCANSEELAYCVITFEPELMVKYCERTQENWSCLQRKWKPSGQILVHRWIRLYVMYSIIVYPFRQTENECHFVVWILWQLFLTTIASSLVWFAGLYLGRGKKIWHSMVLREMQAWLVVIRMKY